MERKLTPQQQLSIHPEQVWTDGGNRQLWFLDRYWGVFRLREGRVIPGEFGAFLSRETLERDQRSRINLTGCNKRLI